MSTPLAAARVSPLDAAQEAIEHTKRLLFPFRFERWLALGFLAFLDQCGRGGGVSAPGPGSFGSGSGGSGPDISQATAWIGAHVGLIVALAAGVLFLVVVLTALALWINSRGIFMYLEAVATGRVEVVRPWREHAERAQSLFAWRFGLAMLALLGVVLILACGALGVVGYSRGRLGGVTLAVTILLALLPALFVLVLGGALASVLLRDIVAPLQWRYGVSCGEGIQRALALVRAHAGAVALYVALKLAFGLVLGFLLVLAGCLTCCLGFLPVVAQTLLQPLFFFERAWSLRFVRQLGCDVFPAQSEPPPSPMLS